jgi:hypothetical protein
MRPIFDTVARPPAPRGDLYKCAARSTQNSPFFFVWQTYKTNTNNVIKIVTSTCSIRLRLEVGQSQKK